MSFTSGAFFAFLAITCAAYYLAPPRWQNPLLLAASIVWAAAAGPWTLGVLAAEVLTAWWIGRRMARAAGRRRTALLWGGIALLLAALGVFKYARQLAPLAARLTAGRLRLPAGVLGVSFYTLMAVGYLIDVYHGSVEVQRSLPRLALFLCFFPQLSSGPIGRAGELLPQLDSPRPFARDSFARGAARVLWGYFQKLVVADGLALAVDPVFRDPAAFSGPLLALAVVLYTVQLYCDFSGYSDIARGLGEIFGITLRRNFDRPFLATNFSGFWSRWHISLSSWFQEYLFMPLAWADTTRLTGGRRSRPPAEVCVFVVFFVSGLWHGSTVPFAAWGLWQAVCRVGEECLHRRFGKPKKHPPARVVLGKRLCVLVLWCAGMVLFRIGQDPAGTLADCAFYYARLAADWAVLLRPAQLAGQLRAMNIGRKLVGYMAAALAMTAGLPARAARAGAGDPIAWLQTRAPRVRRTIYYALALWILCFGQLGSSTFIYFQFNAAR